MANIQVGMLVEIIGAYPNSFYRHRIGHIGKVLRLGIATGELHGKCWVIEGDDDGPNDAGWSEEFLRPINPPKTNQDIQETKAKGCGDWSFLKELLFNKEKENEKV